jgi:hypothetical protein
MSIFIRRQSQWKACRPEGSDQSVFATTGRPLKPYGQMTIATLKRPNVTLVEHVTGPSLVVG